ncbi:YtxH domain-containing protein [Nocardioides mesophilus]|uniref:YtxH domain-containing protein n=1 Tax=Nocardioides mesophilus TaxID=433659 RepID=A0A7G9R7N9_9ACTN|nr:YtxH domain-containing protein [Nocardioides mesophilus]QNN51614.1 YtxH domain-containing protein [Nocardioides mesophilus]
MKKLTLLTAAAVGYVFGSRAGHERYEQIKSAASKVAQDPRVRTKAREAGDMVKEQAPVVKDKVAGAATSAKQTVMDKAGHGDSSSSAGPVTGVDPQTSTPYPSA